MLKRTSWGRFAVALICCLIIGRLINAADAVWGPFDGGRVYLSGWSTIVVFATALVFLGMRIWRVLAIGLGVFALNGLNALAWESLAAGRRGVYIGGRLVTLLGLFLLVMGFRKMSLAGLRRLLARLRSRPR